jgi:hypothetical protein
MTPGTYAADAESVPEARFVQDPEGPVLAEWGNDDHTPHPHR